MSDLSLSKGFVSEKELEEAKRKRQEEWEAVRKPDQPLEAPEEKHDPRPLFERLKEQKDLKQLEFEETHRLKNMFRGLDDEEVGFLDVVDQIREKEERTRRLEEKGVLDEYKKARAEEQERQQSLLALAAAGGSTSVTTSAVSTTSTKKPSVKPFSSKPFGNQAQLILGAVKRKSTDTATGVAEKRQKTNADEDTADRRSVSSADPLTQKDNVEPATASLPVQVVQEPAASQNGDDESQPKPPSALQQAGVIPSAAVCVGVRPSLCGYAGGSGSSDDDSSDSSGSDFDGFMPSIPVVTAARALQQAGGGVSCGKPGKGK